MVRLRLRRVGAKGQPSYRIVAIDREAQRDGREIEIVGFYNPRTSPATIELKEDRIYYWLSVGAQPSESALQVFNAAGAMERYERSKKGEELETLLTEAKAAEAARNINPKTQSVGPSAAK
jgi:small subunit ribosomal protein S16